MAARSGVGTLGAGCALLAGLALAAWLAPHAFAAAIASAGPLTAITVGDGAASTASAAPPLSCEVHVLGAEASEFFGGNACGTFLHHGGTKYGPGLLPFADAACPCVPFRVTSATGPAGEGTAASPLTVTVRATAGDVAVVQADAYVPGNASYTTNVTLTNTGPAPIAGILWRAGDCVVAGSDHSYGWVDPTWPGAVACADRPSGGGRLVEWRPLTRGSHYQQGAFGGVWGEIGRNATFADRCACGAYQDGAAGLSWAWTLAPGASASFVHETRFFAAPGASAAASAATAPAAGRLPVAQFLADGSHASCQDSRIRFAAGTGPDEATYAWEFGDGATAAGPEAMHAFAQPGTYAVRLTVTDAQGRAATAQRSVVSMGDPNCCPVLGPLSDLAATAGEALRVVLPASDFEADPLDFAVTGLPGATAAGGVLEWRPGPSDVGEHAATVAARDAFSEGCGARQAFTVRVQPAPARPAGPDADGDGDGVGDGEDVCPGVPDAPQGDRDGDGDGDACDATPAGDDGEWADLGAAGRDQDRDGWPDVADNCVRAANRGQADTDGDGAGDACDLDADGDDVANAADNCPTVPNRTQADGDGDGVGDLCQVEGAARAPTALPMAGRPAAASPVPGPPWGGLAVAVLVSAAGAALLVTLVLRRAGQ